MKNLFRFKTKEHFKPSLLSVLILFAFGFAINAQEYAKKVDPLIGSVGNGLGCGFNYIGASYPFGMVQFTPSFFSPQKGFVINQLNGAGCPHMGNFPVLPVNGEIKDSPDDMNKYEKYVNVNEANAGFLSVLLKKTI